MFPIQSSVTVFVCVQYCRKRVQFRRAIGDTDCIRCLLQQLVAGSAEKNEQGFCGLWTESLKHVKIVSYQTQ